MKVLFCRTEAHEAGKDIFGVAKKLTQLAQESNEYGVQCAFEGVLLVAYKGTTPQQVIDDHSRQKVRQMTPRHPPIRHRRTSAGRRTTW